MKTHQNKMVPWKFVKLFVARRKPTLLRLTTVLFLFGPAALAGCDSNSKSSTSVDVTQSALENSFDAAGFDVTRGRFEFIDTSKCCNPLGFCAGNNPSSPYAAFYVPKAPGQIAPNNNQQADGMSDAFKLRADEAIVFMGNTPPKAAYFGFTPYVITRRYPLGLRVPFASLGDTLNHEVIATAGTPGGAAGDPFDARTVIIVTADSGTDARVRALLTQAGVPGEIVNTIVVPSAIAKLGLDATADTIGVLFRLALVEDPAAGQQFIENPGAVLLRLTPHNPAAIDPLPAPTPRARGTGRTESAYQPALDRLEAAIRARYAGMSIESLPILFVEPDPALCLQEGVSCLGDNRDTIYPSAQLSVLDYPAGTFLMAFGVNHAATGKATYSNFAVYALRHFIGVTAVDSRSFPGSANSWLPNDPDDAFLYAWKIARQCNGEDRCVEIPTTCPGVPELGLMNVTFRAYLEPETKTAPLPSEIVLDRVLRISPSP